MSSFVKMSLLISYKSAKHPSQFLSFLKQVLVKSGRPHFNIFEQQDAREFLASIVDELYGYFILAYCSSWHQSLDNEDFFTTL